MAHEYLSTYCFHGAHTMCVARGIELGLPKKMMHCKLCSEPCHCACHYAAYAGDAVREKMSVQQKVEAVDRYAEEHKAEHCPNCHSTLSLVSSPLRGPRLMQCRQCYWVVAIDPDLTSPAAD